MKSRLAAGKADSRDVCRVARFADHSPQKIDRKKLSVRTIEIIVRAKAVAAMQVADIRQLHAQTPWSIVAVERGLSLHLFETTSPRQSPAAIDRDRRADRMRWFAVRVRKAIQD